MTRNRGFYCQRTKKLEKGAVGEGERKKEGERGGEESSGVSVGLRSIIREQRRPVLHVVRVGAKEGKNGRLECRLGMKRRRSGTSVGTKVERKSALRGQDEGIKLGVVDVFREEGYPKVTTSEEGGGDGGAVRKVSLEDGFVVVPAGSHEERTRSRRQVATDFSHDLFTVVERSVDQDAGHVECEGDVADGAHREEAFDEKRVLVELPEIFDHASDISSCRITFRDLVELVKVLVVDEPVDGLGRIFIDVWGEEQGRRGTVIVIVIVFVWVVVINLRDKSPVFET